MEVRLVVYARDEPTAHAACRAAFERIADIDECMSDYHSDSELMRLCAASGPRHPVVVSHQLFDVLTYGQEVSRRSNGVSDVTVGPYVRLLAKRAPIAPPSHPSRAADVRPRVAAEAQARSEASNG